MPTTPPPLEPAMQALVAHLGALLDAGYAPQVLETALNLVLVLRERDRRLATTPLGALDAD